MSEMIERVAKALYECDSSNPTARLMLRRGSRTPWADLPESQRDFWRYRTRAAIEAMRPDLRRLVDHVWQEANEDQSVPSTDWADRMIDAALNA